MDTLSIHGARTHNLKNISLDLPRGRYIVFTGVSGSGKSSLAFDTLYAEGERRYVESLSTQARQLLERLPHADVDAIEGVPPAIAIDQRGVVAGAKSTVGTVTEAADYLRLLFARTGVPHCPEHGLALVAESVAAITDALLQQMDGKRVMLLAPVLRGNPTEKSRYKTLLAFLQGTGYRRVRLDGDTLTFEDDPVAERLLDGKLHKLDVVVDRLRVRPDARERIAESVGAVAELADGRVVATDMDSDWCSAWSTRYACPYCDYSTGKLEPRNFSLSSPYGACSVCSGTGLAEAAEKSKAVEAEEASENTEMDVLCSACLGSGLGPLARSVFLANGLTYQAATQIPLSVLRNQLGTLLKNSKGASTEVISRILPGLMGRLTCLEELGLGYLALERRTSTLSGGEAQRIRLAAQMGSGLSGVLYVLDEPCSGLHPRDCARLIKTLVQLRDLGNTLIVVEHNENVIRSADVVVDLGPGAGDAGGEIVVMGSPEAILQNERSLTGAWLADRRKIDVPHPRFVVARAQWLRLVGAKGRNLKNLTLEVPIGALSVVTGISGSGKSTLIADTLLPALRSQLEGKRVASHPLPFEALEGTESFDKVVYVDQSPVGRSSRANPATFTGIFTPIRELFAQTLTARERGYSASRFSFNTRGGRCEACEGEGTMRVRMQFLPDVLVTCDVCGGTRYNRETLECRWKGRHIAEVLELTVDAAREFFAAVPQVRRRLDALADAGLGYLRLGRDASTLSGGEAQRMKLAAELAREESGRTLYILDEPTTGLHFEDVGRLLGVLRRLTARGNTVLVIEHDLAVAAAADWVIDMGPEGGEAGGEIVAVGTPAQISANKRSVTGPWLAAWRKRHA